MEKSEALKKIDEATEELDKEALEKGYDVDVDESFFNEKPHTAKVRLVKRSTVGDALQADQIARMTFGTENPSYQQLLIAKLSLVCKFNDEIWNVKQIQELSEDFLSHTLLRLAKHLQ